MSVDALVRYCLNVALVYKHVVLDPSTIQIWFCLVVDFQMIYRYEGGREIADLSKFLQTHATKPFELTDGTKGGPRDEL